jgi:hypothetical protein
MDDDYAGMNYRDWLHEYEYAVKDSAEKAAAGFLKEREELTGDPMGDCKKIAEKALALKYS